MKIKGKRVLVTGGALRIGAAVCERMASMGASVVVHCDKSVAEADALVEKMGGSANGHMVRRCDFSDPAVVARFFDSCGSVDILVNSASVFEMASLSEEALGSAVRQLKINFVSPLELMKRFAAQRDLTEGCVVNFLDQRIEKVDREGGMYPLSKKVLAEATRQAASQWAPRIRVNGVAPGPVLPPRDRPEWTMAKSVASTPLKRAVSVNDVVSACVFLIENESVTGHIVHVDCGQHLG